MTENVLISLNDFKLPSDFSWRVKFMDAVGDHLRRLGVAGHTRPPRFFGYYFEAGEPVVLTGKWMVRLSSAPLLTRMELAVDRITGGEYRIKSSREGSEPDFLLIHDRFDCAMVFGVVMRAAGARQKGVAPGARSRLLRAA